jgi:hypothetical protein
MRYQQPTPELPVTVNEKGLTDPNGKAFTDQVSLGKYLVHAYNLRTVMDITSCNTCHR